MWIGIRENLYGAMSGGFVLLVALVCAALLLAAGARPGRGAFVASRALPLAAAPIALAVLLAAYVFGEDSYRGNGISRWDAYRSPGGELGELFVVTVAALALAAALIVVGWRRRSAVLVRGGLVWGALVSAALVIPTVIGFTAN